MGIQELEAVPLLGVERIEIGIHLRSELRRGRRRHELSIVLEHELGGERPVRAPVAVVERRVGSEIDEPGAHLCFQDGIVVFLEEIDELLLLGKLRQQLFENNFLFEAARAQLLAEIDGAHPTLGKIFDDDVAIDGCAPRRALH